MSSTMKKVPFLSSGSPKVWDLHNIEMTFDCGELRSGLQTFVSPSNSVMMAGSSGMLSTRDGGIPADAQAWCVFFLEGVPGTLFEDL